MTLSNYITQSPESTRLDAALSYAHEGWSIFPAWWRTEDGRCACNKGAACGSPGKHPVFFGWQVKATADIATIQGWWTEYPAANIALATGRGIVVVDEDVKKGAKGRESLEALEAKHGLLPPTRTSRTPSGGRHFFFATAEDFSNTVNQAGAGLDIRSAGGYVILPGGPDSGYTWLQDGPLAELPDWLAGKLRERPQTTFLDVQAVLNGVPEGQRDMTLWRFAGKLRGAGVPKAMAVSLAEEAARQCEPPFDLDKAREKIERAYANYHENYRWTDQGNAERLADLLAGDARWCTDQGKWYWWNGRFWEVDHTLRVQAMAKAVPRMMRAEAAEMSTETDRDRELRNDYMKFAGASESRPRLEAMVELLKAEPGIPIRSEDLDADRWLLNCVNGTLDLRTGEFWDHRREDLLAKIAGASYQPDATAPLWERFLNRVLPDPEVRAFVQRAAGYSLSGSVEEECLFFLYGTGRNGKSKFLDAMQHMLGDYAMAAPPDLLTKNRGDNHPTGTADLMGTRFVATIETDENSRMAESYVKWLTGGDRLKARFMHKDYFQFWPQIKIWLAANHRPEVYGTDEGIWSRFMVVPFTVFIPAEERDKKLSEKLRAELDGILAWSVQGYLEWRRQGLNPPVAVKAAAEEYREDMDAMGQFLKECVVTAANDELLAKDLYLAYRIWCNEGGHKCFSQKKFANRLREKDYKSDRGTGNKLKWHGIALTADARREVQAAQLRGADSGTLPELSP